MDKKKRESKALHSQWKKAKMMRKKNKQKRAPRNERLIE